MMTNQEQDSAANVRLNSDFVVSSTSCHTVNVLVMNRACFVFFLFFKKVTCKQNNLLMKCPWPWKNWITTVGS